MTQPDDALRAAGGPEPKTLDALDRIIFALEDGTLDRSDRIYVANSIAVAERRRLQQAKHAWPEPGQSAGDLFAHAASEFIEHVRCCRIEDCTACDAALIAMGVAHDVWQKSRYRAVSSASGPKVSDPQTKSSSTGPKSSDLRKNISSSTGPNFSDPSRTLSSALTELAAAWRRTQAALHKDGGLFGNCPFCDAEFDERERGDHLEWCVWPYLEQLDGVAAAPTECRHDVPLDHNCNACSDERALSGPATALSDPTSGRPSDR